MTLLVLTVSQSSIHGHGDVVYAERIRLGLPSRWTGYLPLFVALRRGFFKDENIELDLPLMLPNIVHQSSEKGLGEIPLSKMVDFRILEEIRREGIR
jgi:hypothetical protein